MKRTLLAFTSCAALTVMSASFAWSDDRQDEVKRVQSAADVLQDIMGAPDKGIPEEIMESAKCVGIVPSLKKGGFVFGAEYGRGVASCHNAEGWSAPAPFTMAGGSWGLQIGGGAVDLVMVIMNDKGMQNLLSPASLSSVVMLLLRPVQSAVTWRVRRTGK